jgi:hypothetical protein
MRPQREVTVSRSQWHTSHGAAFFVPGSGESGLLPLRDFPGEAKRGQYTRLERNGHDRVILPLFIEKILLTSSLFIETLPYLLKNALIY